MQEKRFHPTKLGEVVVELLTEHFPDVVDIGFTAELEDQLDQVEAGDIPWNQVVQEFYSPFMADLEKAKDQLGTGKDRG